MYSSNSEYHEQQNAMDAILVEKMREFRLHYNEIKRETPESRFILIVGRTPPPFEKPIQTKVYYDRILNEALDSTPIEEAHIFYMDLFMFNAIFIESSAQKDIKRLYERQSIIDFPLFVGSITRQYYPEFQDVFDAIIFDGGVCYNMGLQLVDIQHMLQYLHNSSSFLLIDSDSDVCKQENKSSQEIVPVLEQKFVYYQNPELKDNQLKVSSSSPPSKLLLFEGDNRVFDNIFQEFDNAELLEKRLKESQLSRTHHFEINIIKRKDTHLAMISAFKKKEIGTKVITKLSSVCLPSETNVKTLEELEELKFRLIEWLNINGFEGQYELIQGTRNFFFIKIQKQVGKSGEEGSGRKKKKTKRKRRKNKRRKTKGKKRI